MNKALRTTGKSINSSLKHYCAAFMMICFLASAVDVINRIILGYSLPWSHDLSVWCIAVIGFTFTGMITMEHTHISVSFLYQLVKGLPHKILTIIFTGLEVIFAVMVFYAGYDIVTSLYQRGITTLLGEFSIPRWMIYFLSVFLGMLAASVYGIITLIRDIKTPVPAPEKKS